MSPAMSEQSFTVADGGFYHPNPVSQGFWSPDSVHARVIIGLLAHVIETGHGAPDFMPVRLTADLHAMPRQEPIRVEVRVVKATSRLKVIDAEAWCGEVSVGRATCQLLKVTEAPEGNVWTPPAWTAPHPDTMERGEQPRHGLWEARRVAGRIGGPAPKQMWMKEIRELVAGLPLTPFVRAALASDYASPITHIGDAGVKYINTDVSLYLHRPPLGEWIGFEVIDFGHAGGVGAGACRLHDVTGPVGLVAFAALANQPRRRTRKFEGSDET